MLALLSLLLLPSAVVRAGYFDEAALDEAVRVFTGPPLAAAALGKGLLVATSANALALISARTGEMTWRTVLPSGAWPQWRLRVRARARAALV